MTENITKSLRTDNLDRLRDRQWLCPSIRPTIWAGLVVRVQKDRRLRSQSFPQLPHWSCLHNISAVSRFNVAPSSRLLSNLCLHDISAACRFYTGSNFPSLWNLSWWLFPKVGSVFTSKRSVVSTGWLCFTTSQQSVVFKGWFCFQDISAVIRFHQLMAYHQSAVSKARSSGHLSKAVSCFHNGSVLMTSQQSVISTGWPCLHDISAVSHFHRLALSSHLSGQSFSRIGSVFTTSQRPVVSTGSLYL